MLLTDHVPLQWLAGQKIEGLLARWTLATQKYDFTISYQKSSANGNTNALSCKPTYTKEQYATTYPVFIKTATRPPPTSC